MNIIIEIIKFFFENLLLVYANLIILSYLVLGILSASALISYKKKNSFIDYNAILKSPLAPSITIIAPAYNESKTIIENVYSLLSLNYPTYEVIIINDGSEDNTLQLMIEEFSLKEAYIAYDKKIDTKPIKEVYRSKRGVYSNLTIVNKANGGKADSLNAGINISSNDYFITIDVDCVLEQNALVKMIKPFIESTDKKVIASGGVIRVANSCTVKKGNLDKIVLPKKLIARFQVLEYFRAFVLGRMAWSRLNGLLLISGAFGMFDKEIAKDSGGYSTFTVGEDLELVIRMRRYMHENNLGKYLVAFIPDPLCWTEVPETNRILSNQRSRWIRGTIESLSIHKKLFFNPKYGKLGIISYPYWLFFEWLAPLVEAAGILYFLIFLLLGKVSIVFFVSILLFIYIFSIAFSISSIFLEEIFFHKYNKKSDAFKLILTAMIEPFIHHPRVIFLALRGNYDFFIKRKHGWGKMKRVGFNKVNKKKQ